MNRLHLHTDCDYSTAVSNIFIDRFMASANGEFVKIYLYLLRCVEDRQNTVSVSGLADFFNQTEADVCRALKYWDSHGVIRLVMDESGKDIADITFVNLTDTAEGSRSAVSEPHTAGHTYDNIRISLTSETDMAETEIRHEQEQTDYTFNMVEKPVIDTRTAYTPKQIGELKNTSDDFAMMLYGVSTLLGGQLSTYETSTLAYFYDTLHFSCELIEYLIEYCVTNGHKSFRYIEKVALAWHEKGISTVKQARAANMNYNDTTYNVLEAFGITNRSAGKVELDYINKWNSMFSNNPSIIIEACNRTMKATHQPSFEYADTILMRWKDANVATPDDIKKMDESYEKSQADRKRSSSSSHKSTASHNKFTNFELQGNIDVDALEKAMLNKNRM